MSARNVLQSPLVRANSLKEKMLETKDKILEKGLLKRRSSSNTNKGRESQLLTKEELPLLMDCVKTLILHLRARLNLEKSALKTANASQEEIAEKTKVFDTNAETNNPMRVLSDARTIRTVAETGHKNLLNALNKFTIATIAGVVRLIFQSADVPLIKAEICAEIFSLQDNANKNRAAIDIDDLRSVLGKAPARNIDILGQLIALLSVDSIGPARLAYSWGPLIFLPRFDHKTNVAKDYESFDLVRQTNMVISVTKLMIEQCVEVFGLDDEDSIRRLGLDIKEQQTLDLKQAAMEVLRQSAAAAPPQPAVVAKKQPTLKSPAKIEPVIGTCRVNYDFDAEGPLEISVPQGEIVSILEKGEDSWWKIRTKEGKEGLVPETYCTELSEEELLEEQEEKEQEAPMVNGIVEREPFTSGEILMSEDFAAPDQVDDEDQENVAAANAKTVETPKAEAVNDEEEIEDEIAALQRKLNELQKLKEGKRRGSSLDQQEQLAAPPAPPVPTTAASQATPRKSTVPPTLPVRKQPEVASPAPAVKPQPTAAPVIPTKPQAAAASPAPAIPVRTPAKPAPKTPAGASSATPSTPQRASFLPDPAALAARKSGLNASSSSPAVAASPLKKTAAAMSQPARVQSSPSVAAKAPSGGGMSDLQAALAARKAKMNQ